MYIFWGTKEVKKRLGYVADFCMVCGSINAFNLVKHSLRRHIYYLPYGKEKNVAHRISCFECGSEFTPNLENYSSVIKGSRLNISENELINTTFPDIKSVYKKRLELERNIKKGPKAFNNAVWVGLIREPFEVYEHKLQAYFSQTQIDGNAFISVLIALSLPVFVAKLMEDLFISIELKTGVIIGSILIGIAFSILQFRGAAKRYVLRKIYPKLALSLKRFRGYETDIEGVFEELKSNNFKIAQKGNFQALDILIKGNQDIHRKKLGQKE